MNVRRVAISLIALAALAQPVLGQDQPARVRLPAYRARILGVFDAETGAPIEGASVIDMASHTSALTTPTGTVSLIFLPDSGSIVMIQKVGYQPATRIVTISPADTVPITLLLKPIAQTLPAVVTKDSVPYHVSPGLRSFEERRQLGIGKFVMEAELRKSDSRSMSNVVRGMGIYVGCSRRTPIKCFAVSTRSGCNFDVYVDGARVGSDDRDLEMMRVDHYGGVEAYVGPATIPTAYNMTGSACGVLLLWSRER